MKKMGKKSKIKINCLLYRDRITENITPHKTMSEHFQQKIILNRKKTPKTMCIRKTNGDESEQNFRENDNNGNGNGSRVKAETKKKKVNVKCWSALKGMRLYTATVASSEKHWQEEIKIQQNNE